ncbi:PAAR domain-containing protein [Aggregatibacter actinomycetemcomitans]|uniref:PAAR domain-containing protein n=1 Tax=Aggregatibacter actinomycetemcomitans TaxID=714 RepID=UPI00197BE96A|nr:PAAR domain-containing protein [Aggregatibacter actinomycetemcomitans]MBN6078009.1 PAAR domain-containing protein [Aggregatibacter actinomycetemcomitans]
MARRAIIVGDTTTHGGTVLNGSYSMSINGGNIAVQGDMVACPECKGVFPIAEGTSKMSENGLRVALEGMKTACGATLIASQNSVWVDDDGDNNSNFIHSSTDTDSQTKNETYQIRFHLADDDGIPYKNTKFSLKLPDKTVQGTTDDKGFTPIYFHNEQGEAEIRLHIDEAEADNWKW